MDPEQALEAFRAYLREHNHPVTAQCEAVAEFILRSAEHLSAEEIRDFLKVQGVFVGMATVYRTLNVLVRSGLVVERDFGEGFKRYEPARGEPQHEHLICTACGRVTEFHDERLDRMTMLVADAQDFVRTGHRLVIYGLCADCRRGGLLPD